MVSAAQVTIYVRFDGDIDMYQRRGSPQSAVLNDGDVGGSGELFGEDEGRGGFTDPPFRANEDDGGHAWLQRDLVSGSYQVAVW